VLTDRTIPNNKLYIIIHEDEKETCMLIDAAISGDKNVIMKEAEKILKYEDLTTEIQHTWNVKTSDTSNKRSNWSHFKIIQKIPVQHTRKARNQGNKEEEEDEEKKGHIGHCTDTFESNTVEVQNIQHGKKHCMWH
jgi:hypothetical protein